MKNLLVVLFFVLFSSSVFASGTVSVSSQYYVPNPWGAGEVTGSTQQEACAAAPSMLYAVNAGLNPTSGQYSPSGFNSQCVLFYVGTNPNFVNWFSNLGGVPSRTACPANSTGTTTCVCDPDYLPNSTATACVQQCTSPAGTTFDVSGSGSPSTVCYQGCSMALGQVVSITLSDNTAGYSGVATSSGSQCNGEPSPSSGSATAPPVGAPPPYVDPCIAAGTCTPAGDSCLLTNSCTGTGTGIGGTVGGGTGSGSTPIADGGTGDFVGAIDTSEFNSNVTGTINDGNKSFADAQDLAVAKYQDDKSTWLNVFTFDSVATGCSPFTGSFHGKTVSVDICAYSEKLRSLLTYLFGLFAAWSIFQTVFRAKV